MRTLLTLSTFLFLVTATAFAQEKPIADTNKSNEMMNRTPAEELVRRFESPERDAYQKPDLVMEYLGNIKGKTIIDIGAGSGYFSVRLAAKGAKVIAADVNDDFLNYLKNRIEKSKLQGIELRKVPFDSPALKDEEVDMVLIVNTYHHIDNRPEYFAKVRKGTKKNGELVIIDFFKTDIPVGPREHKVSIDEAVTELRKAGYTSFEIDVNLLPYQYLIRAK